MVYQLSLIVCEQVLITHTRLMALFPGLPGWAGTRKVKPIWIWLNQETVSGSGISWAMCKSRPHSRQITTPAPHHSVFYRPDALPAAEPTASKHITPSLSVILVSQITLVSVLVLVYNYSLVLVFRRISVLVFTFEGILVSVSGLFFCTRHQIFATVPAIKKSLHNTENRTCTIWKCFSVNYEDNISCNISSVLQTTSSTWLQVENCLVHLQEYTALQCSCGAISLPGCEIPTHAEHTFSVCLGSWSMNQVQGE